jgi:hypothetical protein
MKKTHDYIHYYRGYWSEGGKCRIRIYREDGQPPMVICSQPPDNDNTSVTNMAEYLAAEVMEEHKLPTPLVWIEHYPEHMGKIGEYSLVRFSSWESTEVCLGSVWGCPGGRRCAVKSSMSRPRLPAEEYGEILGYPRYVVCQGRSIATGPTSSVDRRKARPVALRSLNAVKMNGTVLCHHCASSSRPSTTVDTRQ